MRPRSRRCIGVCSSRGTKTLVLIPAISQLHTNSTLTNWGNSTDYLHRDTAGAAGKHTPHLLDEALSWHARYLQQGSMQPT
jgi:hypothetical protein